MDRLSDYDYNLPEELIAQTPLDDRSASRLLVLHKSTGQIEHRKFTDSIEYLSSGDVLVLNDTRVTALRLFGKKDSGGAIEILLLKDLGDGRFEALAKPAKRLRPGTRIEFENGLIGRVIEIGEDGNRIVDFGDNVDWQKKIDEIGQTPLPPYIHERLEDRERYQTVYASAGGSAAAPTAGLHFTPEILSAIENKGVRIARVTLDVGLDTFRPVQSEILDEHAMHGERCSISPEAAEAINEGKGRIVAVGTTAVRTLESMAVAPRKVEPGLGTTKLFIRPGYEFKMVDSMFTNFHLPRTTMLMMISAMAGRESVFRAYDEAIRDKYRFLSFGDSMLIF